MRSKLEQKVDILKKSGDWSRASHIVQKTKMTYPRTILLISELIETGLVELRITNKRKFRKGRIDVKEYKTTSKGLEYLRKVEEILI